MKQPEIWTAQAVAEIGGQSIEPAPETSPAAPKAETATEIAPLIQKVADSSIAEIEKLLGHLQQTRDSLQSEGERIQREAANYIDFTQMASASIRIISETVQDWGKAGYPVHRQPQPNPLEVPAPQATSDTAETLNDTAEMLVQDEETPSPSKKDKTWYARRSKGA
jgi:hypothetical protein